MTFSKALSAPQGRVVVVALAGRQCFRKNCACRMAGRVHSGCFDNCWQDLHPAQADGRPCCRLHEKAHGEIYQQSGQLTLQRMSKVYSFLLLVCSLSSLIIRNRLHTILCCTKSRTSLCPAVQVWFPLAHTVCIHELQPENLLATAPVA